MSLAAEPEARVQVRVVDRKLGLAASLAGNVIAAHPTALGRPVRELWAEIWSIVGPMLHGVLGTGEATWSYDLLLPIVHNGAVGEHYFTFSYSPIRDETGAVRGVFCPVTETTDRVQDARREQHLRAKAEAARDGSTLKLFVELRAPNYPGSTYTLTYDPKRDQLQGIYFQAVQQQRFNVYFVRMK